MAKRLGGNRRLNTRRCRSMLNRYLEIHKNDSNNKLLDNKSLIDFNYLRVLSACNCRLSISRGSGATPSLVAIGNTSVDIK